MIKRLFLICSFFGALTLYAQDYFPKNDGVKSKNTNYTALTGAKILRLSVLIEHPLWIKNLSGGSNFPATAPSSVVRHERAGLC